ncbi:wax ester/triacylglycerol synthase family O-acyltransferase [Hoyosella sp. YIM 151337]|uniref:WS/DGAT/MGAT family O-acyltransferase n=1 Tax=Hoyosella sp. YIM 151337 TaxID=2992742 RepID=UPI0022355071|nr:wax ester/triacylglycerol synthase family O-acyltransferase [Hoyosella sp. YIM 151337]MCW4353383.1 wax ester/triacylglycerol synthase family O-acyltransferase [Hoyosella sp. YIM 151337]
MQRLTGLDASFLYFETSSQLLHVCALMTLDPSTVPGGYSFPKLRAALEERTENMPVFRRKLHNPPFNMHHPVWVEDDEFDIEHHVHHVAVPPPGGREELSELCAHIAAQPMSRRRPLWEFHVIEGAADGSLVIVAKMHHAGIDGVSGASLMAYLASTEPDAPLPILPEHQRKNPGAPGPIDIVSHGIRGIASRPVVAARLLREIAAPVPRFVMKAVRKEGMRIPFTAPRTSFNATITGRRSVAYCQAELDDVKKVKNAFGLTVNDVILAVCTGALRTYLADRHELPRTPLLATIPVSVRGRSQRDDQGSNKVSSIFSSLPTHLQDPADRLRYLADANRKAKEHHAMVPADLLQDVAQFASFGTLGLAVRAYSSLRLAERHPVIHNLVMSNVPGPPMPLYLLGSRITGMFPFGPVFHGAGLNITAISREGRIDFGIIAAANLVPDAWPIADAIPHALAELVRCTDTAPGAH